jgi:hypothetical protein
MCGFQLRFTGIAKVHWQIDVSKILWNMPDEFHDNLPVKRFR